MERKFIVNRTWNAKLPKPLCFLDANKYEPHQAYMSINCYSLPARVSFEIIKDDEKLLHWDESRGLVRIPCSSDFSNNKLEDILSSERVGQAINEIVDGYWNVSMGGSPSKWVLQKDAENACHDLVEYLAIQEETP